MSDEPLSLKICYVNDWQRDATATHEIVVVADGDPDDGIIWEFSITWKDLHNGRRPLSVKVDLWDDAWGAFRSIPEFFQWLERNRSPTLSAVVTALGKLAPNVQIKGYWPDGCGVVGDTPPKAPPVAPEHEAAYARVARWYAHGRPMPTKSSGNSESVVTYVEYLMAGLPGWEG